MRRWPAVLTVGVMVISGCGDPVSSELDAPTSGASEARPNRAAGDEPQPPRPTYGAIVDRDVFRPLVQPRRETTGSAGTAAADAAPSKPDAAPPQAPKAEPPDPMADLALTGVVEVDRELRALIEKVSTRVGEFVAVGEEFDGYRVVRIDIDAVELEKSGERHTLRMGEKELDDSPSGSGTAQAETSKAGAAPTSPQPGRSGAPGQMTGEFGGDMLGWAERQPLSTLERTYRQYSSYMSPDQRRQAEEYLEDRRRRERR